MITYVMGDKRWAKQLLPASRVWSSVQGDQDENSTSQLIASIWISTRWNGEKLRWELKILKTNGTTAIETQVWRCRSLSKKAFSLIPCIGSACTLTCNKSNPYITYWVCAFLSICKYLLPRQSRYHAKAAVTCIGLYLKQSQGFFFSVWPLTAHFCVTQGKFWPNSDQIVL